MTKCVFCLMPDSEMSRSIYEDHICRVILSRYPVEKGHLLVISKAHYADMHTTPDNVVAHMFKISKKFSKRAKTKLKCMGIVVGVNIGATKSISHFHIHILPIYDTKHLHFADGKNEIRKEEIEEVKTLLTF